MRSPDAEALKSQIRDAFKHVTYPGDWCLSDSYEGDEPYWVEEEFAGKTDWQTLDPEFIDRAPHGLGSALCFFSEEAFHFYLPAYLIADIDGKLRRADPITRLTSGLRDHEKGRKVCPVRYGERTWLDEAKYRFSIFNQREVAAIVAFLQFTAKTDESCRVEIEEALRNYWLDRAT